MTTDVPGWYRFAAPAAAARPDAAAAGRAGLVDMAAEDLADRPAGRVPRPLLSAAPSRCDRNRAVASVCAEHRLPRRRADRLRRRVRHSAAQAHPRRVGRHRADAWRCSRCPGCWPPSGWASVPRRGLGHGLVHPRRRSHLDRGVHRTVLPWVLPARVPGWVRPCRSRRRLGGAPADLPTSAAWPWWRAAVVSVALVLGSCLRWAVRLRRPCVRAPGRQCGAGIRRWRYRRAACGRWIVVAFVLGGGYLMRFPPRLDDMAPAPSDRFGGGNGRCRSACSTRCSSPSWRCRRACCSADTPMCWKPRA